MNYQPENATYKDRQKWIVLRTLDGKPCGVRTWYRKFRADIRHDGKGYEYWLSQCFGSWDDPGFEKPRLADDIFTAMHDAEAWLRSSVDRYWDNQDDDEDDY